MSDIGRHELKYQINASDYIRLHSRLKYVMRHDENSGEAGGYKIRSLYFDNYSDKAVFEKLAGVSRREKFRIRLYNDDPSLIRLEKKSKINRLCYKESTVLSQEQCREILSGRYVAFKGPDDPLLMELYVKMRCQNLRPRTIVDYYREAYVYPAGNVRVTFDTRIKTSNHIEGLFDPELVTIPATKTTLLEIKYDGFIPEVIRGIIQIGDRFETEFSKYVVSRFV